MRIGLDIETTLDHKTIHVVKTINLDTGEVKTWKEAAPLRDWLKDATLLVAHNGIGFDFRILTRLWGMKMTTPIFDSLVVSKLLKPNRENGHSLAAWGERLGKKKLDYAAAWCERAGRKQAYSGECFDVPFMDLLDTYCTGDVEVLRDLYLHLEKEWAASGFSQESFELEHEVAGIIAQQEDNGFKLDQPYATCLLVELKGKLAEIDDAMQAKWPPVYFKRYHKTSGKELKEGCISFNVGSRKQVAEKLKELGWKPKKLTPTGQPVVDEEVLDEIIKECS